MGRNSMSHTQGLGMKGLIFMFLLALPWGVAWIAIVPIPESNALDTSRHGEMILKRNGMGEFSVFVNYSGYWAAVKPSLMPDEHYTKYDCRPKKRYFVDREHARVHLLHEMRLRTDKLKRDTWEEVQ